MISTDDFRKDPSRAYKAGETVFREGDDGFVMYVVLEGAVKLSVTGRSVEKVVKGGVFGEMALIDDAPRAAAALASEPTEVVVIDKPTFLALIAEEPEFALQIMKLMAERVRRKPRDAAGN